MTTANDWRAIKRLECDADRLGMKLVQGKFGTEFLALVPKDDSLPIYSRDAELATGSAEHLQSVIQGWNKAYEYFFALKVISQKKVLDAELRVMHDRTAHVLATGAQMERISK